MTFPDRASQADGNVIFVKEQGTTYDHAFVRPRGNIPHEHYERFKTTSGPKANSIARRDGALLSLDGRDRLVLADGQERKKYRIERQTSKLFAACASMLGSKLPVFS